MMNIWSWEALAYVPFAAPGMPPHTRLRRITRPSPSELAVSLEETVLFLRLAPGSEAGPEKPLLEILIAAATQQVEHYASIAVMNQTWLYTMPDFPRRYGWTYSGYPTRPGPYLELPLPPVLDVHSVKINGVAQEAAGFSLELDDRLPALLYPVSGTWPTISPSSHAAVAVEYRAGRLSRNDVDPTIKQAILMAVASWYENRESLQQFELLPMVELGWESLLGPYRPEGLG